MESSSAIDLRALPTTTPAASIRDSVGERPRSPQLENNLESGIEQADVERVSGSGFDISNVANQHHSHLPAEDDAPLEEYLQNLAYSNDEARRLLYNYKTFRQQPGISLFSESTGVFLQRNRELWHCHDRPESWDRKQARKLARRIEKISTITSIRWFEDMVSMSFSTIPLYRADMFGLKCHDRQATHS